MADSLLLIHAFPLDATMWDEQVAALSSRVQVLAPSMPGFAASESAGDVMTMAAAADRCVQAMDDAGVRQPVVCGLSMGGYVALELWRSHRDRVGGLVLANTRPGADDEAGVARRQALAQRLREEGSGFLVENPGPLLSDGAPDELWERVRSIVAAQPPEAIAAASVGMAGRPDSTPDLPTIDVPTLVITSSGDSLIPADQTTPMAHAIPGATLEVLEGPGHMSNLEASDQFTALLEEHLSRCGL